MAKNAPHVIISGTSLYSNLHTDYQYTTPSPGTICADLVDLANLNERCRCLWLAAYHVDGCIYVMHM
jgi:hypothetical protein